MRRGTYSIVARDPGSGSLGVAVHSHWFSVGPVVAWARAGVGAVATQSVVERGHGPRALARMEAGEAADHALRGLVDADELADVRQVAGVDVHGRVAVHTGERCIAEAGHVAGEGFSCQANMMRRPGVPAAMAETFAAAEGPLAERLLAALEAAEAAGGDVRGRQSAALVVVPGSGEGWRREVDVRVDDHPEPVSELGRLLVLARAYALAEEGDTLAGRGDHDEAARRYLAAAALAPGSDELQFWAGLGLAQAGDVAGGVTRVRAAARENPGWTALLARLEPDMAPSAAAVRAALGP